MKKVELYEQFLKEEGYAPKIDEDGDLAFKHEGGLYYVFTNEDDPRYFCLNFPGFWSIDSPEELQKALLVANDVTRGTKVVKITINSGRSNTSAGAEIFVEEPEDFKPIFKRCITAIQYAVRQFATKMREE